MTAEPQSIVHQVLRLEQMLVKAVSSIAQRRRRSRHLRQQQIKDEEDTSDDFSQATYPDSLLSSTHLSTSFHQSSSSSVIPEEDENTTAADKEQEERSSACQTLNQNDFLTDVMMAMASEMVFVHFFIQNSDISKSIDERMDNLKLSHPNCSFVRIDASMAPYIARQLKIENGRPSVVAMKDGKLVNVISDFVTADCGELDDWIYTVELLRMFKK